MGTKGDAKKWADLALQMGWEDSILKLRLFVLYVLRSIADRNPKIASAMLNFYFTPNPTTPAERNYHVRGREMVIAIYGILSDVIPLWKEDAYLYENLIDDLLENTQNEVTLMEEINYAIGESVNG